MGFTVIGPHDLPSVPLLIGDELVGVAFAERLRDEGIFCPIMRWPAVPVGQSRLRISLMTRHEYAHLDRMIEACAHTGRELGVQGVKPAAESHVRQ